MPARNRHRKPARRQPFKEPKRRLLIFCEGEVTEPTYLKGLVRTIQNATVEIEVPRQHGVPLTLVKLAKDRKVAAEKLARKSGDAYIKYDETWCVFDIDEHPNINDARQLANSSDIQLAISNPCFELWLLLHFRDSPGDRHRHDVQKILREILPRYDKSFEFVDLIHGIQDAIERAVRLNGEAEDEGEPFRNPTTRMNLLAVSILAQKNQ